MQSTPGAHPRRRSLALREAIRDAIYAAEDAGEPCPTIAELSLLLEVSRETLRYHLRALVADGSLEIRETRRRVYCRPRPAETEAALSAISLDESMT